MKASVALVFSWIGISKLQTDSGWIPVFARIAFGQWFRYFTGAMQLVGAVLVVIPRLFVFGILVLSITMVGAMAAWLVLLGAPFNALVPGIVLGGLLYVGGDDLIELMSRHGRRLQSLLRRLRKGR